MLGADAAHYRGPSRLHRARLGQALSIHPGAGESGQRLPASDHRDAGAASELHHPLGFGRDAVRHLEQRATPSASNKAAGKRRRPRRASGVITVRTQGTNGTVRLSVTNEGELVPTSATAMIFDPLMRAKRMSRSLRVPD